MNEIKYRIYGKENRIMYSWEEILNFDSLKDTLKNGEKENQYYSQLLQYTGLKDKDGKEIYVGDILSDSEEKPLYVEFSTEYGAFCFVDKFDSFGTTLYTTQDLHYEGLGIIGNVYENPELLQK